MFKIKGVLFGAIYFAAISCLSNLLQADAILEECKVDKKYKLSICAIFKNEARYLKEWIEYHKLVGIDHFYLYDNGSRDRSLEILLPYIKEGLVTCVPWPDRVPNHDEKNVANWALSTQLPAYENAAKYRGLKDTRWLVFIDVDEFLVPVQGDTISDVLERYDEYPGLQLTSDCFDASQIDVIPRRDLLIATTELTGSPVQNIQKGIEKTIFKPDCQTSFTWPPYRCRFKNGRLAAKLGKNEVRINKYVNRYKGVLHFGKPKERLHVDSRMLTESETRELLEIGFEIEDKERAIYRFEPQLRSRMGLETGWNW